MKLLSFGLLLALIILPKNISAADSQDPPPPQFINQLLQVLPLPSGLPQQTPVENQPVPDSNTDQAPAPSPGTLPDGDQINELPDGVTAVQTPEPSAIPLSEIIDSGEQQSTQIDGIGNENAGNQSIEQPIEQPELLNENLVRDSINTQNSQTVQYQPEITPEINSASIQTTPTNYAYRFARIRPPVLNYLFNPEDGSQYYKSAGLSADISLALMNLSSLLLASGILIFRWDHFREQFAKAFKSLSTDKKQSANKPGGSFWEEALYFKVKK